MSEHLPAWRRETQGELRWPVTAVVLVTVLAQCSLPEAFTLGPTWAMPTLESVMLLTLFILNPGAIHHPHLHLRRLSLALTSTMAVSILWSAVSLIVGLLQGTVSNEPITLLRVGATVWTVNVVLMALWYWELDRGGAAARARAVQEHVDFLFPQMTNPEFTRPEWEPSFVDYLYTSFTNATAFSPTDVLPLTRWAKVLMMLQSSVSLTMVALIIARAVNTFG